VASAGPLRIRFAAPPGPVHDVIAANLALYTVPWPQLNMRAVELSCTVTDRPEADARGDYMVCAQMLVDATTDGLRATTTHGGGIRARFTDAADEWSMSLVPELLSGEFPVDVEDMLSLVLTTGWRRARWVPVHAGGLTDGRRGLLVCAGSGGGKTTFTLAMVRRGWRTLGDDKLLLAMDGPAGHVNAIKHVLNVDPAVARWFPEVGDLSAVPQYSAWTLKRRVALADLWPSAAATEMTASSLLVIERRTDARGVAVAPISTPDAISALLHQSVIPTDPRVARPITRALATLGQRVSAFRVTVGDDAYADHEALTVVEDALR
jgi:hypothetical protein